MTRGTTGGTPSDGPGGRRAVEASGRMSGDVRHACDRPYADGRQPDQADAITAAVRQAAEHEATGPDVGALVTKNDLRAEIAGVDARLAALELRLIKWIVGACLAAAGIVIAALRLME